MKGALMIGGTASHVGKSVLVAGLCRILQRCGVQVAPFKAQNMALNSYVCLDGAEIGRAQVVQAQAAGVEPESDMNPILLKPTNERMQVVLHGRVHATMTAAEYYSKKAFFFEEALRAFHRLRERFEVIIIEGAGSIAEVNLRDRDIVNLPFAAAVNSPVVLVGDIDRGGVFASIVGTVALLDPIHASLVRGFVINRFRGDPNLFADGPEFLEARTGIPCFGVVPHIDRLQIEEEDSVALDDRRDTAASFRVGVIRLPHISNYTDFAALESIDGLGVTYVQAPKGTFDLIVLPGTKNTIGDLRWLIAQGFPSWIAEHAASGVGVLGICGGYQMLGAYVRDPHGVECGEESRGLGLLPIETELERVKVTSRSSGRSFLDTRIDGYEIHMGRTRCTTDGVAPFCVKDDGSNDGAILDNVAGTYFHGLFDNVTFTERYLSALAASRGLEWKPSVPTFSREAEYDRLAETLRGALHLDRIFQLLEVD